MRLRTVVSIALGMALAGGGVWAYGSFANNHAVGAGGLPLIKADTNPVKIAPEDSGEEIIPNAESTVFSAMGQVSESAGAAADPSMQNVTPPESAAPAEEGADAESGFAGFKTGFALPKPAERKTESLFDKPVETSSGESRYLTGLATPAETHTQAEPENEQPTAKQEAPEKPEPVMEEAPKELEVADKEPAGDTAAPAAPTAEKPEPEPEQQPEQQVEQRAEEPVAEKPAIPETAENVAQAMEEQEKGFILPVSKPSVPAAAKNENAEPAPKKEEPEAEAKAKPETKPEAGPEPEVAAQPATKAEKPAEALAAKPARAEAASGQYFIQIGSAPEGADSKKTWAALQARFPSVLAGLKPFVQTVEIPGKGKFVRMQAGPLSKEQANDNCKKLRELNPKGGCLVVRH